MKEILELLYNSRLDASGLSIEEKDLEAIADAVKKLDNTNVGFRVDTESDSDLNGIYHLEEDKVIFYVNAIRKTIQRYLNNPELKEVILGLSKEDYEIFVKGISLLTVLHEYDHVLQWATIRNRELDNPEYLLLELSRGRFKAEDNPELRELLESKFGPLTGKPLYGIRAIIADDLVNNDDNHDLRPFERMANFHSYEQLVEALKLDHSDESLLINIIKVLKLKPLVEYYGMYKSPTGFYISNIGGIVRYGEDFEKKFLKLYRDFPADYRFYAGLSMTKSELKPYRDEVEQAIDIVAGGLKH